MIALWQKESKKRNALYVNIFKAPHGKPFQLSKVREEIASELANFKAKRPIAEQLTAKHVSMVGAILGQRGEHQQAIKMFNKCLCLGEFDAQEIKILYTNRAGAFHYLKMFDKCLVDIRLAKAGNMSEQLIGTLNHLEMDCNLNIENGRLVRAPNPKLSFDSNQEIPELANAIKIDMDQRSGRRVTALTDLDVDQIFLLESAVVGERYAEKYISCCICLRISGNLVPCKNCKIAMFWCGSCENDDLHQFECGIKRELLVTKSYPANIQIPLVRSIALAVRIFPNVDALMKFVEKTNETASPDVPKFIDDKSKYQTFLKLKTAEASNENIPLVYSIYNSMLDQTKFAEAFNTEEHRRFLMHLIAHHLLILQNNNLIDKFSFMPGAPSGKIEGARTIHLIILKTFFRHSCAPNVSFYLDNGTTVGVIMRPIKNGEELCIQLDDNLPETFSQRQQILLENFQLRCRCELCRLRSETYPPDLTLRFDSDYLFVFDYMADDRVVTDDEADAIKAKCVSFLQKHGRKWSDEVSVMACMYEKYLSKRDKAIYSF